ncbi:MAG: MMPL family transporter [Actinomycetota bacterium]|nr:MMPL family transporter [Actinomycetota bacterium]
MKLTTESLARASSRRPWLTIGLWIVAIAASGFMSSMWLGDALTTDANFTNEPEAVRATELIEDRLPDRRGVTEMFILSADGASFEDPAMKAELRSFQQEALALQGVTGATTYLDTEDPSMISTDGSKTIVPVQFAEPERNFNEHLDSVNHLVGESASELKVQSFGPISLDRDFSTIAEEDLAKGEMFGIAIAAIVLLIVFGALTAGALPLAMAIGAIAVALGLVSVMGQAFDFSFFVQNMITMMGLAVGIDYSLFIVSRYREERARGLGKHDAIAAAGATANRAVFFSGMTVVLALLGMLIIPTTIFRSLAAGSIFVVIAAVLASLTLLPALLALLGEKVKARWIFRKKERAADDRHGFWNRVTHGVMRRPVLSLVVGAGILLAASFSYFDINTGFSGVSTLPDETKSKQAFQVLAQDFSGGSASPIEIVVEGDVSAPEVRFGISEIQRDLASDGMFGPSQVRFAEDGELAVVSAPVKADPSSEAAVGAVDRIREEYVPASFGNSEAEVLVGGNTAFNKDFFDLTDTYTPIVFVFVLGLSFLLLTVVFRSIVVPIKALLMNLLSVGAAYGLIVLVIQNGVGADLFGFQQVEAIEAWLPLFLFSVLFGLSMDYHVFLLSRIRERFDQTGDNTGSVAYGLRTTAGLITGAALIMVAVFGGFAAGDLVSLQQMGFGLAVAVLIDATIVRSILVPASMKLLGERNWYLPRWLQWLPQVHIEGRHEAALSPLMMEPEPVAGNGHKKEEVPTGS